MNNLIKNVEFQGQQILSVIENNKIYISVKSICDNLGMSKDQKRNQRNKMQKDELLKLGLKFTPVDTGFGIKETLMIELDYLPIWLAKINPARFDDELKDKLMIYQLRAKDTLAEAFLGKRENSNKTCENDWALKLIHDKTKQAELIENKIMDLKKELTAVYDEIDEIVKIKRDDTLNYFERFKKIKNVDINAEKIRNTVVKSLKR